MSKDKRSKKEQEAMAKYLSDKFAEIDKNHELIPVILQRGEWEALKYSIELALKLDKKKEIAAVKPTFKDATSKEFFGFQPYKPKLPN